MAWVEESHHQECARWNEASWIWQRNCLMDHCGRATWRWRASAVRRQLVFVINDNRFSPRPGVSMVAHQSPELQHCFVTKTALEDALLPGEIVALTTLPQSGFGQQPVTKAILTAQADAKARRAPA